VQRCVGLLSMCLAQEMLPTRFVCSDDAGAAQTPAAAPPVLGYVPTAASFASPAVWITSSLSDVTSSPSSSSSPPSQSASTSASTSRTLLAKMSRVELADDSPTTSSSASSAATSASSLARPVPPALPRHRSYLLRADDLPRHLVAREVIDSLPRLELLPHAELDLSSLPRSLRQTLQSEARTKFCSSPAVTRDQLAKKK